MNPELRIVARKVGNPIGAEPTPAEVFELVRRFRDLSPADRGHVLITVTMLERHAEQQERSWSSRSRGAGLSDV